jgi:dolichyl-phosphate-mannose-protein mannosyltransferase
MSLDLHTGVPFESGDPLEPEPWPPEADARPVAATREERRQARRKWWQRPVVVIMAVTAFAGFIRFYRIEAPHAFVFDEVYYAKDGCYDAGIPYTDCQLDHPGEQTITVHPPLGRWLIAGGIELFSEPKDFHCKFGDYQAGCDLSGARAMPALFGTLSVLLLAILAYRLWRSSLWAGVTGLLMATENLNFVQSRVAMLDIFLATFVVAGFLFLVLDREWIQRRTPPPEVVPAGQPLDETMLLHLPPDRPPSPVFRPWRLAAGIAFGAATSVKWSGAPPLLAAIILSMAWERSRRKEAGFERPLWEAIREEGFGIFVFLVFMPMAAYFSSYWAYWAGHGLLHHAIEAVQGRTKGLRMNMIDWYRLQRNAWKFSINLSQHHPYASRPWGWLILSRPVSYYYQCAQMNGPNCARPAEILGMGHPLIFWGTIITLPYTLFAWMRRHDWRAGLIFTAVALPYFAWWPAARHTDFLFYMTPITPFMVLAAAYAIRDLSDVRVGIERVRAFAPAAVFLVVAAVGLFVFFLPVLTGAPIKYSDWHARMWCRCWI